MKRFLTLILFSILIPIQNSSAVSPSLEETMDFLINGNDNTAWIDIATKEGWSIDNKCILIIKGEGWSGNIETQTYDLNKVIVQTIKPVENGFEGDCKGNCRSDTKNAQNYSKTSWRVSNGITWERNVKALSHLYSKFCRGASTF